MFNVVWKINWMKCSPIFDNYENVVVKCEWECSATMDNAPDYFSSILDTCNFSAPSSIFTPYQDLTEEQVLEWVWNSGINKTYIESNVKKELTIKINPSIVELPLPWST